MPEEPAPNPLKLTRKPWAPPPEPPPEAEPVAREVMDILRINREAEKAHGLDNIVLPPKRKSRRFRDYLIILALGDLMIGVWFLPNFIFLISALLFYSAGITWVMLFCFDDY